MENNYAPRFDLHLHSYFSDGIFSPEEVIKISQNAGLEAVSLTDHECVDGIPEAIQAGKKLGVRVIPGVELSADHNWKEYHVLGYFIDYQSERLEDFFYKRRRTKIIQIKKMVEKLQNFGFVLSFEDIMVRARGSINRPHLSWAVFRNPANNKILEQWGAVEQQTFFRRFLLEKPAGEGLAYENRERPSVREVIDLIQLLGGLSFWAHPFSKIKNMATIWQRAVTFRKFGLNGVEACYISHNKERVLALHQMAQELSMYESGGSDFHGIDTVRGVVGNFQTFGVKPNFPFEFEKERSLV